MYKLTTPFRWLRALFTGYFWINCERCGQGFGGFEWKTDGMDVMMPGDEGRCAYCPPCARTRKQWDSQYRE